MRSLADPAIEAEIVAFLDEAYGEFKQGFDTLELLARHFVRLSPEAQRTLALKGLHCLVARHDEGKD